MNNPYRVLGTEVPPMFGREELYARVVAHLDQEAPEHVSVVGPHLIGKSVLLREIARRYAPGRPGFITSVYVDMRHGTPATDDAMRAKFADALFEALESIRPNIAGILKFDDVPLFERLQSVARDLHEDDDRVLVVLDGFDSVLANPGITEMIWNNMREMARLPVMRYVTGSRRPLRELCRTPESRTSDFWEIFYHQPVAVGPFDTADWDALLAPFAERGVEISAAARQALVEWTGGVPILTAAVLQGLWEETGEEGPTPDSIAALCESGLEERSPLLEALWENCTAEMKVDLADLATRGLKATQVPERRLHALQARGFVERVGKQLHSACRLMDRFASREAPGVDSLQRLFGESARFESNVRNLLEMRLAQTPVADAALTGFVEQAIRSLQPEPRHAIVWMRSIVDRAFDLIWERELKDGITLPQAWLAEWERARMNIPHEGGRLPPERGRQMRVLRVAVGTAVRGQTVRRVTRHINRSTALLLEHLQSVGNFGQHQDEQISRAFAVSVCLTAIALCASIAGDLGDAETAPGVPGDG